MKSAKSVLPLESVSLPFQKVFPVQIEGCINNDFFTFRAGELSTLTYPQYENLRHSDYGRYLD